MIYDAFLRADNLYDLYDMYDLAHVPGWEPYNLHDLLRGGIINTTYGIHKNLYM